MGFIISFAVLAGLDTICLVNDTYKRPQHITDGTHREASVVHCTWPSTVMKSKSLFVFLFVFVFAFIFVFVFVFAAHGCLLREMIGGLVARSEEQAS